MAHRALTFGFGGYAELAVTFGEFIHADHTIIVRYMPQYPYGDRGVLLADAGGSKVYSLGQGNYCEGTGGHKKLVPSVLSVRIGSAEVLYLLTQFVDQNDGPVG